MPTYDVSKDKFVRIFPVCTFPSQFGRCVKTELILRNVFFGIPRNFLMLAAATADPAAAPVAADFCWLMPGHGHLLPAVAS